MTNWETIFGTHVTSKGYKILISECKNIKETLPINKKRQTIEKKNDTRLVSAKSQKKFKSLRIYEKKLSLIRNQGNSNETSSGSPFLIIRLAKVKNNDKYLTLRISRNGCSLKLHIFSIAAVTNCHKLSCLKQHKFIILCWLEV